MPLYSSTQKTVSVVEESGLKIRSLQFKKVLAETAERAMKIILEEQFLFIHFRWWCVEREVHLLILLDCPLLRRARNSLGSLMPFQLCGSESFTRWYYLPSTLMFLRLSKAQVLSLWNSAQIGT